AAGGATYAFYSSQGAATAWIALHDDCGEGDGVYARSCRQINRLLDHPDLLLYKWKESAYESVNAELIADATSAHEPVVFHSSDLRMLSYFDDDPARAARIANALADYSVWTEFVTERIVEIRDLNAGIAALESRIAGCDDKEDPVRCQELRN